MVVHPLGFIMGPYTYMEWLTYAFDLFDYCHLVADRKENPDWSQVFFRHNDDFVGGNFKYFYPLTLIMINQMQGLANQHGAANDASRGVDLYETLEPKDLNPSDKFKNKGHMITCPLPHYEFLRDIHKINEFTNTEQQKYKFSDMEEQAQSLVTGHVKRYTEDSNTAAEVFR